MVDYDNFYVITIGEHGKWADRDLLKIVKNNFPKQIEMYKLKEVVGMSHDVNEKEHLQLRAAGINSPTEIDGSYYFSPGGGINSAKGSVQAVENMAYLSRWYEAAEETLKINSSKIYEFISQNYGFNGEKLRLKMEKLEKDKITVVCKDYGFSVSLHRNEKGEFENISISGIE